MFDICKWSKKFAQIESMSRVICLIMIKINSKSKVAEMIQNRKVAVMPKKIEKLQ